MAGGGGEKEKEMEMENEVENEKKQAEAAALPSIARKPVPVSEPAPAPVPEPTSTPGVQALTSQAQETSNHHHRAPAWWLYRCRHRCRHMTQRQKFIALAVLVLLVVIALVLGLAIGLTRKHKSEDLPLPSNHGGPYTGDLTYYEPGLGACGVTSSSSDYIVAVSHVVFDAASSGSNPNANPLCAKKIRAKRDKEGVGERTVDLTVVDRCVGCKADDIDVTTTAFEQLADLSLGRVTASWSWLD